MAAQSSEIFSVVISHGAPFLTTCAHQRNVPESDWLMRTNAANFKSSYATLAFRLVFETKIRSGSE